LNPVTFVHSVLMNNNANYLQIIRLYNYTYI